MIPIVLKDKLTTVNSKELTKLEDKLKEYMGTILPIYKAANNEKKAELRKHNPTLNTFLNIMGE